MRGIGLVCTLVGMDQKKIAAYSLKYVSFNVRMFVSMSSLSSPSFTVLKRCVVETSGKKTYS